ncbi:hypothetical protein OH77DRAFT_313638 [Trametes cingulata]|nr:hypothetical protein OH77DRAFT_313638 [Trametes cingulata]
MNSCPLPLEICEAIMDEFAPLQSPLRACSLTCRAWRYHAQRRLRQYPCLLNLQSIATFLACTRANPDEWRPLVLAMRIGSTERCLEYLMSMAQASDIIMYPFPHLRILVIRGTKFDLNPRLLRMRRPFFANIRSLKISRCWFDTVAVMFDIIWSCPELVRLELVDSAIRNPALSMVKDAQLSSIRHRRGVCAKLTHLNIMGHAFFNRSMTILSGHAFGPAVTNLNVWFNGISGVSACPPRRNSYLTRSMLGSYRRVSPISKTLFLRSAH